MLGFFFFRKSLDINGRTEGVRCYKEKTREGAQLSALQGAVQDSWH